MKYWQGRKFGKVLAWFYLLCWTQWSVDLVYCWASRAEGDDLAPLAFPLCSFIMCASTVFLDSPVWWLTLHCDLLEWECSFHQYSQPGSTVKRNMKVKQISKCIFSLRVLHLKETKMTMWRIINYLIHVEP